VNVNSAYITLLSQLMSPAVLETAPRELKTRELLSVQSIVNMADPRVLFKTRKLSHKFMYAEAAWILSGDNRVSTIAPYNKNISPYADDGHRYFGAYGPKVIDQLPYVVAKLRQDVSSRQAVINIWRENPPQTKDVPCTLSLQFLIRMGRLWCLATMRSSDAWLGWPYDVFNFSMVAHAVLIYLQQLGVTGLSLGNLVLTAGSQHIYERHYDVAKELLNEPFPKLEGQTHYEPSQFKSVDEFVDDLWAAADTQAHS
jgi:thymidylate synthase